MKEGKIITNEVPPEIRKLLKSRPGLIGAIGVIHDSISRPRKRPLYILICFVVFLICCFGSLFMLALDLPLWYRILCIGFIFFGYIKSTISSLTKSHTYLVLNVLDNIEIFPEKRIEETQERIEEIWRKWDRLPWWKKLRVNKFLKKELCLK